MAAAPMHVKMLAEGSIPTATFSFLTFSDYSKNQGLMLDSTIF